MTDVKLTKKQIQNRIDYIKSYVNASNAASGSEVDANANVSSKNIATLSAELYKSYTIQINRALVQEYIANRFGEELAEQYVKDLDDHLLYCHDESSLMPYCVSISMYPFLRDGMTKLGGESKAPNHLDSFIGSFSNLIFAVSSQFAGAVAASEFLFYFAYFARKDYGENWFENKCGGRLDNILQDIVYTLNQPATARGFQSVFFNISLFDKYFFDGLFGDFYFPDGTQANWEDTDKLQRYFMDWFRKEREKTLLTFPVVTLSALVDDNTWIDKDCQEWAADEYAKGSEFFIYTSKSVDSLSSCCRLRNSVSENEFSYSLGAGGVMTGSKNVITLNVNAITQKGLQLSDVITRVHKYQVAFNDLYKWYLEHKMLTVFDAGLIDLDKQYMTLGINGLVEAAEFLGYDITNNDNYKTYLKDTLNLFKTMNKEASKEYKVKFNTELVPAENLGVKNAKWDKKAGLVVNRECYNSYFYKPDVHMPIFDKLELHGGEILDCLDGGSAVHFNNDERLTKPQYMMLFDALAVSGSNYFCENVPKTICINKECGYIHANHTAKCPKCGSDVEYATRVIGYLKRISNFSEARQREAGRRVYHSTSEVV